MDRCLDDIFKNGHVGPEIELLKNHGKFGPDTLNLLTVHRQTFAAAIFFHLNRFARDRYQSTVRCFKQIDATKHGTFTRSAGPENSNNIALTCGKRNPFEYFDIAETFV